MEPTDSKTPRQLTIAEKVSMCVCLQVPLFTLLSGAHPGFLEMGDHMYKCVGVRFADFISFFLNFL